MRERLGFMAVALVVLLWMGAVVPGAWSLRDLAWPYDVDGFRDVGTAQRIRDGGWMSDPLYQGEAAWYPPLVPAIISFTSFVSGLSIPTAYVATGLWLNSLIPVAFFLCAQRLLGTCPAIAALCGFLFLPGRPPAWASATYSPWPFPAVAAQIPFYFGVWAWTPTLERANNWRLVGAGVFLGLTFLSHSAAGIVLGGIMVLTTCAWRVPLYSPLRRTRVIALSVPFAIALLVVSPFILPIASQYGFHILNREPASWAYEPAYPSAIVAGTLRASGVINLVVLGTGIVWMRRHVQRSAQMLLASWALVGMIGLVYSVWAEESVRLPAVVPAYHFLFVLRAVKWLVFGCGLVAIMHALVGVATARMRIRTAPPLACASAILVLALAVYPRYLGREAFVGARQKSQDALSVAEQHAYEWIRSNTDGSAVFLSSDSDAVYVVGSAGRFVVCVQRFFSNPYVRHEPRASARDAMFAALRDGDRSAFEQRRRSFAVSHVLARDEQAQVIRQRSRDFITPVFSSGSLVIFEVAAQPQ